MEHQVLKDVEITFEEIGNDRETGEVFRFEPAGNGEYRCLNASGKHFITVKTEVYSSGVSSHCFLDLKLQVHDPILAGQASGKISWLKVSGLKFPRGVNSALANGFNCWSDSPMLKKNEMLFGETDPVQEYFGDAWLYKYRENMGEFHAWSYSILDHDKNYLNSLIAGVCEDRFYNLIELDLNHSNYNLMIDLEGLDFTRKDIFKKPAASFLIPVTENSNDSLSKLGQIWFEKIKNYQHIDRLENAWNDHVPVTGYTSWYNKFTEISESWLLDHIKGIKQHTDWKIFQVDDGYQKCVGDWLTPDKDFPNTVDVVIKEAVKNNLMPGIWMAPFVAMEFSDIVQKYPDLVVKYPDGRSVVCGDFPHWGGKFVALDTESDIYRDYIESVVKHFASTGIKFIKADFLYGASMVPRSGMTRAEVSARAHQWFYELCRKYDIYFLSCGAPMATAYGRCDFSRIGADVAVEYQAIELETHKSRERPSAKASMVNTITRSFLNGVMFYNDPDVVILREENTDLVESEKEVLVRLNRDLGGLVFSSDSPHLFQAAQTKLLEIMEKVEKPLTVESIKRSDSNNHSYVIDGKRKSIDITVEPRDCVALTELIKG